MCAAVDTVRGSPVLLQAVRITAEQVSLSRAARNPGGTSSCCTPSRPAGCRGRCGHFAVEVARAMAAGATPVGEQDSEIGLIGVAVAINVAGQVHLDQVPVVVVGRSSAPNTPLKSGDTPSVPHAPDLDAATPAPLGHQVDVSPVVLVAEEGLLPTVSSLGDVMQKPRHYDTCDSWHDDVLDQSAGKIKKSVWRPPSLLVARHSLGRDQSLHHAAAVCLSTRGRVLPCVRRYNLTV